MLGGLAGKVAEAGEQAFQRFVRGADDRRLERIVGSEPGLRALFGGMTQRFRPDRAEGFTGEILYDLRAADGQSRPWTVQVAREHARAGRAARTTPR